MPPKNRYEQLIEAIFFAHFSKGVTEFEFEHIKDAVRIVSEKHYRLVHPKELTAGDFARYKTIVLDEE